jgi:hypothetical protein
MTLHIPALWYDDVCRFWCCRLRGSHGGGGKTPVRVKPGLSIPKKMPGIPVYGRRHTEITKAAATAMATKKLTRNPVV